MGTLFKILCEVSGIVKTTVLVQLIDNPSDLGGAFGFGFFPENGGEEVFIFAFKGAEKVG